MQRITGDQRYPEKSAYVVHKIKYVFFKYLMLFYKLYKYDYKSFYLGILLLSNIDNL